MAEGMRLKIPGSEGPKYQVTELELHSITIW